MNKKILRTNIESEKRMLMRCKKILRGLPQGTLTCYKSKNSLYFKKYDNKGQKYIGTENNPMVSKLKMRHLLEVMINKLESNIKLMDHLLKNYQEFDPLILQKNFKRPYQNIPHNIISELGYYINSKEMPFYDDKKIYTISSGLRVRSRVEAMIAELYIAKGIAFNYEAILQLPDGKQFRPDFTIYCPSQARYKYHEHIGLLSDPDYMKGYLWKLEQYISNGLYPFIDVLFTYEKPDHGFSMSEIENLIDSFMR